MAKYPRGYWCQCGDYHPICGYCGKVIVYNREWASHPCTIVGRLVRLVTRWLA
ncbi:MAG: hypothetical protein Q7O66_03840 [Dehalococcoidia bacterium]|nr:hypothetical protein [Dehalococcoidia bacterium]